MKKKWVEPEILVQQFVANEYVAACYKIRCTTPNHNDWYNYIYADTNSNGKWDSPDKKLYEGRFHGCNQWHKGVIRDDAPVANGFVTTGTNPSRNSSAAVFYWYENFGSQYEDIHVMTPGKENYETNPNAS